MIHRRGRFALLPCVIAVAAVEVHGTDFASRAAVKLRQQHSNASQVLVFMHTSAFRVEDRQYSNSITVPLRRPTADSAAIVISAVRGAQAIYRPGYKFAKCGVMLLDLQDAGIKQGELALDDTGAERTGLMGAMDRLNDKYGRGSVVMGSAGLAGNDRRWVMRQERKTPDYTTRWADMPVARA